MQGIRVDVGRVVFLLVEQVDLFVGFLHLAVVVNAHQLFVLGLSLAHLLWEDLLKLD